MADKGNPICFLGMKIRMVLVGKTREDKHATVNTIYGAGMMTQIYESFVKAMSAMYLPKEYSFTRFGYDLQLVNVPGFCETSRSDENIKNLVMESVGMSVPGIHAFLFIVRLGRFTEEDKYTLKRFLQCFGEEAKRFVIVVFTGKDYLGEAGYTLDNYIDDCPMELKQFLFETNRRLIAVNNRGTDEEKEKFTKDLIDMVKNMAVEHGGECYPNEVYERCQANLREKRRKELEKKLKQFDDKFKQESAALEQKRLQMIEAEEQLNECLKATELREKEKEEEEKKYLEEETKRQGEIKEAHESMRREFERIKELQRIQMEEFERRKKNPAP